MLLFVLVMVALLVLAWHVRTEAPTEPALPVTLPKTQFRAASPGLERVVGGVRVRVERGVDGRAWRTRATFASAALPSGLRIERERARLSGGGNADLQTGDPAFDAAVALVGDAAWRAVALAPDERAFVAERVRKGFALDDQAWRVTVDDLLSDEACERYVAHGLRLCALTPTGDLAGRLAERVQRDPPVARAALRALLEHYADDPETQRASRLALLGTDPALKLLAAIETRDFAALTELASTQPTSPAGRRAVAVALREWPEAEPYLLPMLDDLDESVAAHAAASLGTIGTIAAVPALVRLRDQGSNVAQLLKLGLGVRAVSKAAAYAAIAEIHRRVGATDGALAVADGGGLAVAETEDA